MTIMVTEMTIIRTTVIYDDSDKYDKNCKCGNTSMAIMTIMKAFGTTAMTITTTFVSEYYSLR